MTIALIEFLKYKRGVPDQIEHQQLREEGNNWIKFLFGDYNESRIIQRLFSRRKIKTSDIERGGNPIKLLFTCWLIKSTCFMWTCNRE